MSGLGRMSLGAASLGGGRSTLATITLTAVGTAATDSSVAEVVANPPGQLTHFVESLMTMPAADLFRLAFNAQQILVDLIFAMREEFVVAAIMLYPLAVIVAVRWLREPPRPGQNPGA